MEKNVNTEFLRKGEAMTEMCNRSLQVTYNNSAEEIIYPIIGESL